MKRDRDRAAEQAHHPKRLHIEIGGAVQGVGFRPFIYRTAIALGLAGWVRNNPAGVVCEAEACDEILEQFLEIIRGKGPPLAKIHDITSAPIKPTGSTQFEILTSDAEGPVQALALPDIATCPECRHDIFDPDGRRYGYPFTNCTNCGPRYSILARLPYDRANTSMAGFSMCAACQSEYSDPLDRRFHAQPNCCPECGPQISLWDCQGQTVATRHEALLEAAAAIRNGKIVAVKGLGGFLLQADARNSDAVSMLRERKRRPDKPFAVMCPDLAAVKTHCQVSAMEEGLLESPQSPIVLLGRRLPAPGDSVCANVAPGCPNLGILLPYTPLHHILMQELEFPVVATSGNLSDEPLAYDNFEALDRLRHVADLLLVHDRPILAPVDDSVLRVMDGLPMILRRARGYSPYPLLIGEADGADERVILAVGGHLSNTVSLLKGRSAHVGPYIGNLESPEARDAFGRSVTQLKDLNEARPDTIACDLHNDYHSSRYAEETGLPIVSVQHHVAHIAACMAEHGIDETVLGVAWDGAGLGDDGTLWGGEFLRMEPGKYQRIAHLSCFQLPGGEAAVREPRRAALGVLWALDGCLKPERATLALLADLTAEEQRIFSGMLKRGVNAPITSSAGRLFDAVAALVGLRSRSSYQGQAASELEWAIKDAETIETYPFELPSRPRQGAAIPLALDWKPMMQALLADLEAAIPVPIIAAKFHNTLVEMIVSVVQWQRIKKVVFSGGCFQNRYLIERVMERMRSLNISPFFPRVVPPNDGGISLGQAFWAYHVLKGG